MQGEMVYESNSKLGLEWAKGGRYRERNISSHLRKLPFFIFFKKRIKELKNTHTQINREALIIKPKMDATGDPSNSFMESWCSG